MTQTQETVYFITPVIESHASMVHSSCYRLALSMLRRADKEPAVVHIESMNYTALIFENSIYFVNESNTMTHNGESGHPVCIEWQFLLAEARNTNDQHIPMESRFYTTNLAAVQQKLTVEFYNAMMHADELHQDGVIPTQEVNLVSLTAPSTS